MKLVKFFLQKKAVTLLLLALVLAGGLLAYIKMGKLEDAPFTIKQAMVLTPYPGASPSEVQSQVTDILEESIQSLGELYYLKTENRAGLSKITVYVKKEIRADEMQQLWDKLRRKVNDVQGKLPAGAGPSVVMMISEMYWAYSMDLQAKGILTVNWKMKPSSSKMSS